MRVELGKAKAAADKNKQKTALFCRIRVKGEERGGSKLGRRGEGAKKEESDAQREKEGKGRMMGGREGRREGGWVGGQVGGWVGGWVGGRTGGREGGREEGRSVREGGGSG